MVLADCRYRLGHGLAAALYIAAYSLGRGVIELLRIDEVNYLGPLRLNVWTSALVFALAVGYLGWSSRRRPGREDPVEPAAQDGQPVLVEGQGKPDLQ